MSHEVRASRYAGERTFLVDIAIAVAVVSIDTLLTAPSVPARAE